MVFFSISVLFVGYGKLILLRFDGKLCKIVSIDNDQKDHGHLKATDRYFYAT